MEDFHINRPTFTEKKFREEYDLMYDEPEFSVSCIKTKVKGYFRSKTQNPKRTVKNFFLSIFPILTWLPKYKIKEWLVADIISGVTIGVMQIPQGMSYSLLAGQHPIHGLYNAFFPVFLYTILGTSRHVSMGAFAITSLMLGAAVTPLIPDPTFTNPNISKQAAWDAVYSERIQFSVATIFLVGIFLLGLSFLNLGSIVTYLSDPMISGFTCGAAFHVLVSQFKSLLGVSVGSYSGPLNIIWVISDVIKALVSLDPEGRTRTAATAVISAICIIFLLLVKEVNERYKKKLPLGIPIPGEVVVVIVGTGVSYGVNLASRYGVIVGDIPSGLPIPTPPPVNQLPSAVGAAIPIAIVGYSVAVSIAKIFGNNFGYTIRPNQELFAYGISNTVASFFSCIPAFPSMSRSCVQVDSGGKTQLVGIISTCVILLVLLVIGPLFKSMPRACLGAVIAVAIKGMLRKAKDFKPLWKVNRLDGAVWLVSCLCTIFLDVVYGLAAGVGFSFLCVVFRTQFISSDILSRVSNTEIYRKQENPNRDAVDAVDAVVLLAFNGPLHYVTKDKFRQAVVKATGIDPSLEWARRDSASQEEIATPHGSEEGSCHVIVNHNSSSIIETNAETLIERSSSEREVDTHNCSCKCVIIDCTRIGFMDSVGVKSLKKITEEYKKITIPVFLTHVGDDVSRVLQTGGYIESFGDKAIFLTNHDAVLGWNSARPTEEDEPTRF